MRQLIIFVLLSTLMCFSQAASQNFISSSSLQSTISDGLHEKGRQQGLELVDVGQRFAAAFATANAPQATGYRVVLYTPVAWVKQQASNAAKEYRPFSIADVNDDMRSNVLRVVVYPSLPTHVIARGAALAHSVQHVVIRDASRHKVVQPLRKDDFTESAQNAMGAKLEYHGVSALFPLEEVERLRDENEEFFVTVVGDRGERDFKVKRKHLEKLPFAHIAPPAGEPDSKVAIASTTQAPIASTPEKLGNALLSPSHSVAASLPEPAQHPSPKEQPPVINPAPALPVAEHDETLKTAEACLLALKKVDAGYKVAASPELLTSALMEAQLRLDEFQARKDKDVLTRTLESAAFSLDGFIRARKSSGTEELGYARLSLQSAIENLESFKTSGHENVTTKAPEKKDYPNVVNIK